MYNNYGYGGGYMPPQMQYNNPQTGLKGRPVSSVEEVRAAQIDFDGSLFVFPDVANKRIYTKQINLNGTATMNVYTLVENTPPEPAYVTREEMNSAIEMLKNSLSERKIVNEPQVKTTGGNAAISF